MGGAIGATLGYAVGIAISPLPVAAVILMLFSGRARRNAVWFMVAWIVGVAGVVTLVQLVPGLGTGSGEPGAAVGWVKLVAGVLLLVLAVRRWSSRPGPDDAPRMPGWMSRVDGFRPAAAAGLGLALSAVNPKNLLLAAAAGASVGALSLSTGETAASVAVFTALATLTVTAPVVGYLVAGRRIDPVLDRTKTWLIRNDATVTAVLLVVLGAVLLGDALRILT